MKPEQLQALKNLAAQVKADYQTLPIIDVLNRIHFITNRDYAKSVEGLRMMLQHGAMAATFIPDLHKLDSMARWVDVAFPILERFDAKLCEPDEFGSKGKVHEVVMFDGPTDDEPEVTSDEITSRSEAKVDSGKFLSHINSNF